MTVDPHITTALAGERRGKHMGAHMKIRPQPAITPELLSDDLVADLVRAAAAGDEHAWNALVAKFSGLLWAIARAHRLYHADAADVVQVTWLRLLEQLGRLRNPSRVGAWLATTARRECLRVLRHSERVMCLDENARERQSNELGPDDVLLERERDGALWRGFTRLRTSDQELLRLLVVDPRPPYEEIAAVLDMPIGSIGPTRQRALKRLRHELDGEGSLALVTPERRSST